MPSFFYRGRKGFDGRSFSQWTLSVFAKVCLDASIAWRKKRIDSELQDSCNQQKRHSLVNI